VSRISAIVIVLILHRLSNNLKATTEASTDNTNKMSKEQPSRQAKSCPTGYYTPADQELPQDQRVIDRFSMPRSAGATDAGKDPEIKELLENGDYTCVHVEPIEWCTPACSAESECDGEKRLSCRPAWDVIGIV
jgi:hypothetical protein